MMTFKLHRIILLGALLCVAARPARAIDADLGRFSIAKQKQIRDFADTISTRVPATVWRFYEAVRVDDWKTATNLAMHINAASHRYSDKADDDAMTPALGTLIWPPISETYGAYIQFHNWDNRWLHRYGDAIIKSIPPGSIYFGGTDPGRFVISVLCESQVEGRPFFTLTQNQLVDSTYLDYLRAMYGKKIHLPSIDDVQEAFTNYLTGYELRKRGGRLLPGESVAMVDGRPQVSGQISVMEVNGLLAKDIFEANPERQFYVEESFPLDWMYKYLTPHGLIFQLNNNPVGSLTEDMVAQDQAYWKKLTDEMFGPWLDDQTSLTAVCDQAMLYGLGEHLDKFTGDKVFAANAAARKCYSKLRSSQGGLYAWRADRAKDPAERRRMYAAADLAFRQSYTLCPYSPEAAFRYVNLLLSHNRMDDAILVMKTSVELVPENEQFRQTLEQLMKMH
jgi:hypothetical protein